MTFTEIMMTEEMLLITDIKVDEAYQRCRARNVENRMIKRGFSETLCGRIVVGRRTDGSCWVVDGQTRTNAAAASGRTHIPARIFISRGRQHEAELFVEFNSNRRSVKAADYFKAAVEMGEVNALEMQSLLTKFGLKIGYGKKWPHITGYAKLRDAHCDGHLHNLLSLITLTWFENDNALKETFIGGVSEFLRRFPDADLKRCVTAWKGHAPSYFIQGSDLAQASGGNRYKALAIALAVSYNKGLRSNKLEWQ